MQPYRIPNNTPAQFYKTYQIVAPKQTHFRPATCDEVNCVAYQNGWKTTIDTTGDLGQKQFYYITKQSGKHFKATKLPNGLVEFEFTAGQPCFTASKHQVKLDRPEIFLVRDGDHRGNPRGTTPRKHTRASDWVEDFAEHQSKVADDRQKG